MQDLARPSALRTGVLLAIVLVAWLWPAATASAAERQMRALVLYSTRPDAQIAVIGERDLPRILADGLEGKLDYYSEFIDRARFPDAQYKEAFRGFLRSKYKNVHFNVIIVMQDLALEFVGDTRNELFPDTPLVFFATSAATRRIANSTGVVAELDFRGTLQLAAALQPEAKRIAVVVGADAGSAEYERAARRQFSGFEQRFSIEYLTGLRTEALRARLAELPAHSFVYYLVVNRAGGGESVHPIEYLEDLSAVSRAPIYCWVDSAMDHGIVGGSLKSQTAETEAVARLALRVLQGERADDIPVTTADLNIRQVDWRQLRRWNISEARVPAGTLILFREPTVWGRYRSYLLGTVVLLLAQSALIAALLVQRRRRRQAEEQVRSGQVALQTSYGRIRDLGGRLLSAQETERSRIARELHDDISQQVALLSIDLEILKNSTRSDGEFLANEALTRAQDIARSVHDLSHRLHPARLRLIGLVAAINGLQHELSTPDVTITFTHRDVPPVLPEEITLCIFRVVQEALQNALKYSRAGNISVHLAGESQKLLLAVADDGVGFDVDAAWGSGLGLISMSERLESIDATMTIRSTPGAGACLDVAVPLQAVDDAVSISAPDADSA
jgi:signal transduction histidine kinase